MKKLKFPISGFPEFSPEVRAVELHWTRQIAKVFESFGYINVETPSVERVETLAAKGEDVDKEIYAITRLGFAQENAKLALHYDLTIPFARYVADNFDRIVLPFKRYQIQRVWRGERPQEGRYREFTQCDIDVVDQDRVADQYDAEVLEIVLQVLHDLEIGPVRFMLSNRKLLDGLCDLLGIQGRLECARILDKVDKLPAESIKNLLIERLQLPLVVAEKAYAFACIKGTLAAVVTQLGELGITGPLIDEGLEELSAIYRHVSQNLPEGMELVFDLSIVRGFDYYTGVVYEARMAEFPEYPSICAGGRYENLIGSFMNRKLPGVGISIGLTRIFTKLLREGRLREGRASPTDVLFVQRDEIDPEVVRSAARQLRERGFNAEVYPEVVRMDRQLKYADRKGIPHVWFCEADGLHSVKSMATGAQVAAELRNWQLEPAGQG